MVGASRLVRPGVTFAVVAYYYDTACERDGRTIETGGRDVMTLVKEDGRWWVVANRFSEFPPARP